ncbi:MAG TPA: hypothetical protein EYP17_06305 [Candidatus Latescibacteria bacterium]|nr:hypothetical protein [Candidatus Latescibacterota bacterium]
MFVNPEVGDFHLREGSPRIDGGNPDPEYNDPDGSRNDIGIYGGPYAESGGAFTPPVRVSLPETVAPPGDTLSILVEIANAEG